MSKTDSQRKNIKIVVVVFAVLGIALFAYAGSSMRRITIATIKPYKLKADIGLSFLDYETEGRRFYDVYYWGAECSVTVSNDGRKLHFNVDPKDSLETVTLPPSG